MDRVNKTIYWLMGGLMVIGLVYIGLNAVSIGQRLMFLFGHENPLDRIVVQSGMIRAGELAEDPGKFPQIFVDPADQQIEKVYADNFQNNYIYIPSLGIEAPIVFMDNVDESNLQVELKKGVGHYPQTALPGEAGNVFIFGHSSYYWWDWSPYSAVFANLENIRAGDRILVYYGDRLYIYRVSGTKVVDPSDMSVLDQGREHKLTLMTCTPLGTSLNRFIVSADLVN